MKKMKNFFTKFICFSLIFTMLPITPIQPTTTVRADNTGGHHSYFIETLLNNEGGYDVKVHSDSTAWGDSLEEKTMKKSVKLVADDLAAATDAYLDWRQYSVASIDGITTAGLDPFKVGTELSAPTTTKGKLDDTSGLIFSFPSNERGVDAGSNGKATYSSDYSRAATVSNELIKNLNSVLGTIKDSIYLSEAKNTYVSEIKNAGSSTKISDAIYLSRIINPESEISSSTDVGDFRKVSVGKLNIFYAEMNTEKYKEFLETGEVKYGSLKYDGSNSIEVPIIDAQGNLLMYLIPSNAKDLKNTGYATKGMVWAMPKGYLNPVDGTVLGSDNPWGLYGTQSSENMGDAVWLSIFSLAEYANAQAQYAGYTATQAANQETNFIEDAIYNIVMGVYTGLITLLKLDTITELIYEDGFMSDSWWNQVLRYHLIFQIVAWMMLIVAVAKILIQINFSTVNPTIKMSIMDTGQKLLTVGFALALCIPFIRMLGELNFLIVNIFKTQAINEGEMLLGFGLVGILLLFGYFSITFTMNCIYIMRSIMIAILTASAPLFITSMAFAGPKQKGLLDNWLKEISANIFMQSIHAFAFAFLWDIMDNSRLIIRLVIYFSLLPIVDMCKQLVFGQAGSFAYSQGHKAGESTMGFIQQHALENGKSFVGNRMKAAAANRGYNVDTAANGGSTAGETKASKANNNFTDFARQYSSEMASNPNNEGLLKNSKLLDNKLGKKINDSAVGKWINENTKAGSVGAYAGKAAMNLASNGLDYFEASGGFANNAVIKANRGDASGSVEASTKQASYEAHATDRNLTNLSDMNRHRKEAKEMSKMMDLSTQKAQLEPQILEAKAKRDAAQNRLNLLNAPDSTAKPAEIETAESELAVAQQELGKLNRQLNSIETQYGASDGKYQGLLQSGIGVYNKNGKTNVIFKGGTGITEGIDGNLLFSRDTFASLKASQQAMTGLTLNDFGNNDYINLGKGSFNAETGDYTIFDFGSRVYDIQKNQYGNSQMSSLGQEKFDKTKNVLDSAEKAFADGSNPTLNDTLANKRRREANPI